MPLTPPLIDAAKLVDLRTDRGLSRAALAHRSGISGSWLKQIETRGRQPSLVVLKALKVEVEALTTTSSAPGSEAPARCAS